MEIDSFVTKMNICLRLKKANFLGFSQTNLSVIDNSRQSKHNFHIINKMKSLSQWKQHHSVSKRVQKYGFYLVFNK